MNLFPQLLWHFLSLSFGSTDSFVNRLGYGLFDERFEVRLPVPPDSSLPSRVQTSYESRSTLFPLSTVFFADGRRLWRGTGWYLTIFPEQKLRMCGSYPHRFTTPTWPTTSVLTFPAGVQILENRHSQNHTLCGGVKELLSVLSAFTVRFGSTFGWKICP